MTNPVEQGGVVVPSHETLGRIIGACRKRIEGADACHTQQWRDGGLTAIRFIEERVHRLYVAAKANFSDGFPHLAESCENECHCGQFPPTPIGMIRIDSTPHSAGNTFYATAIAAAPTPAPAAGDALTWREEIAKHDAQPEGLGELPEPIAWYERAWHSIFFRPSGQEWRNLPDNTNGSLYTADQMRAYAARPAVVDAAMVERAKRARKLLLDWRKEMPKVWYGNKALDAGAASIAELLAALGVRNG